MFAWVSLLGLQAASVNEALPPPILLRGVSVVPCTGEDPRVLTNQAVLLHEGRIAGLGAVGDVDVPPGVRILDARGLFLMPGLWDMHVHPDDPEIWERNPGEDERAAFLDLFVLHGVTGVRDMGGDLARVKGWRDAIERGERLGPRILFGGPLVDGPEPMWPGSIACATAEDGRAAVRRLKAEGVDFVKVYSLLPREAYFAIAEECRAQGMRFAGHVPDRVTNREAVDAGQASLEHLLRLHREFGDLDGARAAAGNLPPETSTAERSEAMVTAMLAKVDWEGARSLFRHAAARGVAVTPTLLVWERNAFYDPAAPEMAARLPFMPPTFRAWWSPEQNVHLRDRAEAEVRMRRALLEFYFDCVRELRDAGVTLMTGSDCGGNPLCFPGWGVHDELALLVRAGLTPHEALLAATRNPARFLGLGDRLGTVEGGKFADLVLLEADPLADVANVRKIRAVIVRGRMLERAELDARLTALRERFTAPAAR